MIKNTKNMTVLMIEYKYASKCSNLCEIVRRNVLIPLESGNTKKNGKKVSTGSANI